METPEDLGSEMKPSYQRPALIAGGICALVAVTGNIVNPLLCLGGCVWGIGFGVLAAHLLAKSYPSMSAGQGTGVGALAGLYGGLIAGVIWGVYIIISGEFVLVLEELISESLRVVEEGGQASPEELEVARSRFQEILSSSWVGPVMFLLILLVIGIFYSVMGTIGGAIGGSLFGKKDEDEN